MAEEEEMSNKDLVYEYSNIIRAYRFWALAQMFEVPELQELLARKEPVFTKRTSVEQHLFDQVEKWLEVRDKVVEKYKLPYDEFEAEATEKARKYVDRGKKTRTPPNGGVSSN